MSDGTFDHRPMLEFIRTPIAQAVLWTTILVILVSVGVFVVAKFRDRAVGSAPLTPDLLSTFREMQQQGDLSETEFRTIKTKLGATLHDPVTDSGNTSYDEQK